MLVIPAAKLSVPDARLLENATELVEVDFEPIPIATLPLPDAADSNESATAVIWEAVALAPKASE